MSLNSLEVEEIVQRALMEDIGSGDITTAITIPPGSVSRGEIIAKEEGVIAGLQVAATAFALAADSYAAGNMAVFRKLPVGHGLKPIRVTAKRLNPVEIRPPRTPHAVQVGREGTIVFHAGVADGASVRPGDSIAELTGPTAVILTAERTALNFLQRLSGIATRTARFVELVKGTGAKIMDTRKTTPGLRFLEKYAVRVGGGRNHRFGLYDAILIKDNHIRAAGGIHQAIELAKSAAPHTAKIEVEADDIPQVEQALEAGADVILLDNMSLDTLKKAVALCKGRALTEASGRITEENVAAIAATGVDLISIGALTHSVKALDISLEVVG